MGSNFNQNMAGIRRALGENFGVRGTRVSMLYILLPLNYSDTSEIC